MAEILLMQRKTAFTSPHLTSIVLWESVPICHCKRAKNFICCCEPYYEHSRYKLLCVYHYGEVCALLTGLLRVTSRNWCQLSMMSWNLFAHFGWAKIKYIFYKYVIVLPVYLINFFGVHAIIFERFIWISPCLSQVNNFHWSLLVSSLEIKCILYECLAVTLEAMGYHLQAFKYIGGVFSI